jgi:uncharacterized membrane protein YdjX (TVP38/TMEM64 family)
MTESRRHSLKVTILVVVALISAAWYFNLGSLAEKFFLEIQALGTLGVLLFIVVYAVACVLIMPVTLLSLAAGATYGLSSGFIYVTIGANLGAAAAFLLGRYFVRKTVQEKLDKYPRFSALDRAIAERGWQIVLLCRLSPVFPFNMLNYFFGLSQVRFKHYVIATLVGMLPSSFLFLYIGSLAGDINRADSDVVTFSLRILGLLATLAATLYIAGIARRSIEIHSSVRRDK